MVLFMMEHDGDAPPVKPARNEHSQLQHAHGYF